MEREKNKMRGLKQTRQLEDGSTREESRCRRCDVIARGAGGDAERKFERVIVGAVARRSYPVWIGSDVIVLRGELDCDVTQTVYDEVVATVNVN